MFISALPTLDGWTPVTGSGCGRPVMTPGTAVGMGNGHTVGGVSVVPGPGDGVGMYVHWGTWQQASFGSATIMQSGPKLLYVLHLRVKIIAYSKITQLRITYQNLNTTCKRQNQVLALNFRHITVSMWKAGYINWLVLVDSRRMLAWDIYSSSRTL